VVCVAAGNAGPAPRTVGSPGCANKVISVGASDQNDQVAGFSSRGPTSDGRVKPDLCFPGVGIAACRARGASMGQVIDEHYTTASGTSMATPHCAGAAALLLEADRTRTPQAIKDLLMGSAKDLNTDVYAQGRGRAQVYEAYLGHVTPPPPPPPPGEGTGCLGLVTGLLSALRRPRT
jgi:serine protease AprX